MIILLQRGVDIARFARSTIRFFMLKKAAFIRFKAAQSCMHPIDVKDNKRHPV